jgi:hypothetical protein
MVIRLVMAVSGHGNSDGLQFYARLGHVRALRAGTAHTLRFLSRIGTTTILGYFLGGSAAGDCPPGDIRHRIRY